jgi:Holliday junction resolvase RusA-like endonuclease
MGSALASRLILPLPPSTNKLYSRSRDGQVRKSDTYKSWEGWAGWEINAQRKEKVSAVNWQSGDWYSVVVEVPVVCRMDADNVAKPILDLLHRNNVTPDDKFLWSFSVRRSHEMTDPRSCAVWAEMGGPTVEDEPPAAVEIPLRGVIT